MNKRLPLLIGAVTLFALVLRLVGIGDESLWLDEGWSAALSAKPTGRIITEMRDVDVHPPLYILLLKAWRQVFASHAGMRALSAVLMAAAVPFVFLFGRRLGGTQVGVVSALLTACSPALVFFGQEMRSYALVFLLASISCAMWVRLSDGPRRVWIIYTVSTALLLWTHYLSGLLIVAQAATMFRDRRWWKSTAAIGALFLPWAPVAWTHVTGVAHGFWITPPDAGAVLRSVETLCFHTNQWTWIDPWARTVMLFSWGVVLVIGFDAMIQKGRPALGLAAVLLVPPVAQLLISFYRPIYYTRTFLYVALALYTIAGLAVASMPSRSLKIAVVAVLLTTSAVGLAYQYRWTEKEDIRGAVDTITRLRRPEDGLLVHPDKTPTASIRSTVEVYLGEAPPRGGRRIWVVKRSYEEGLPAAVGPMERAAEYRFHEITVYLFLRR